MYMFGIIISMFHLSGFSIFQMESSFIGISFINGILYSLIFSIDK